MNLLRHRGGRYARRQARHRYITIVRERIKPIVFILIGSYTVIFGLHLLALGYQQGAELVHGIHRGQLHADMEVVRPIHFPVGSIFDDDVQAVLLEDAAGPHRRDREAQIPLEEACRGNGVTRRKTHVVEC